MVELVLNATLSEDVSNSLQYIGKLKDEGEGLEEMIQTIEDAGYGVKISMSNGELVFEITDK